MSAVPRLVIAAPASGAGKTTVSTGLMAAFAAAGQQVSAHKVGPDYIDPGYHALATGRPGRNLDPHLLGEHRIAPLFQHGARDADLAVIEGVMGLYDGAAHSGESASTAHVAKLLGAPVVLVVDAASQGRSVAALLHGFASYDPALRLDGVILNRVGSFRHEQILREAVDAVGLRVYGVIYREHKGDIATPSRHLGLIPAAERSGEAVDSVRRLGALTAECCDLEGLLALACSAPTLSAEPWDPDSVLGQVSEHPRHPRRDPSDTPTGQRRERAERPKIAVAGGAAFTFSYAETTELLDAAGADVVTVDPLRDDQLPRDTDGLMLGGGFPEMYADELSANERLRTEVGALAAARGAIVAECAGLLYLATSLDGRPMCGVLDAEAKMSGYLTLGYRDAVAVTDSYLARAGERVSGHEFHRTQTTPAAGKRPAWQWSTEGPEGYVQGHVHASYLHLHWAGHPELAHRFVEACA